MRHRRGTPDSIEAKNMFWFGAKGLWKQWQILKCAKVSEQCILGRHTGWHTLEATEYSSAGEIWVVGCIFHQVSRSGYYARCVCLHCNVYKSSMHLVSKKTWQNTLAAVCFTFFSSNGQSVFLSYSIFLFLFYPLFSFASLYEKNMIVHWQSSHVFCQNWICKLHINQKNQNKKKR